jgi:hypothetical protein
MKNGRCRMHGGLSTGPRTAEGLVWLGDFRPRALRCFGVSLRRMRELGDRAGLAVEALAELRIGRERVGQNLDHDDALQPQAGGCARPSALAAVHSTAAVAQRRPDAVSAGVSLLHTRLPFFNRPRRGAWGPSTRTG